MRAPNFGKQYQSETDEELLRLAAESEQLAPEALDSLRNELARRRISHQSDSDALGRGEVERSAIERALNVAAAFPRLSGFVDRIKDWRQYRHQTGEWPLFSIGTYFLNLAAAIIGLIVIVWYGARQHWSKPKVVVIFLLLAFGDGLFLDWLLDRIRLREIQQHRRTRRKRGT